MRIAAAPLVAWLVLAGSVAAAPVFVLAALTDFADGLLARRTRTVTELGKALDPVADRVFTGTVLVAMTAAGRLPLAAVVLVVLRDLVVGIAYRLLRRRGVTIRVSWLGKSYTALLMAAIVVILAGLEPWGLPLGRWMFIVGVAGSLLSGAAYLLQGYLKLERKDA